MTIARPAGSGGGVTAAEVEPEVRLGRRLADQDRHRRARLRRRRRRRADRPSRHQPGAEEVRSQHAAAGRRAASSGRRAAAGRRATCKGEEVFAANAPIPTLRWTVFVESPRTEAFAPLYATLQRTSLLLVAALLISIAASFFLARALVRPLRALQEGAAQIGAGDLERHIEVRTGDELEGPGRAVQPDERAAARVVRGTGEKGRAANRRADRVARVPDRDGGDPQGDQQLARRRAADSRGRRRALAHPVPRRRAAGSGWSMAISCAPLPATGSRTEASRGAAMSFRKGRPPSSVRRSSRRARCTSRTSRR